MNKKDELKILISKMDDSQLERFISRMQQELLQESALPAHPSTNPQKNKDFA